jgi:hypothetical protein
VPPEYISADGLPGLGGCSLICVNEGGAGDWTTKTCKVDTEHDKEEEEDVFDEWMRVDNEKCKRPFIVIVCFCLYF